MVLHLLKLPNSRSVLHERKTFCNTAVFATRGAGKHPDTVWCLLDEVRKMLQ